MYGADKQAAWWEAGDAYRQFDETAVGGERLSAWISEEADDEAWDEFLDRNPGGQFHQSSFWASAKASEGWSCVRLLVGSSHRLVGGLQMLWRSSWFGRIGYLSKGPVLDIQASGVDGRLLQRYVISLLKRAARRKKLRAVIVQPPDVSEEMSGSLRDAGLLPGVRTGVNDATCIVDLSGGFDAVERRMDRSFRKCLDRARRGNLQVREGQRSDLTGFYELMLSSCRRQNVTPNPSNLGHLLALWDAAHRRGAIRLHVVERDGEPVAGQIDLLFGKTVTFWKKGWNGAERQLSPNDVCMYEGIRRASQEGYSRCDFAAFDRKMAISIINGHQLTAEQAQSRYVNFFRTGGRPVLLPRAQVFFPNRILQAGYRLRYFHQMPLRD